MSRLGFSSTSDYTCGLFRELDDRGSYGYEELAQLCATAPSGPLTGVWMSHQIMPLTEFPRLFPVVVIDDGTDVFVRSLPGTLRHLTMKLSFKHDLILSGPVAIHRPGEAPSWDRTQVFHEHIRFLAPHRDYERLRCLDGEWQRSDLLAFETRARSGVGKRSGREWLLHRCTTSLDRATLDQYVDRLSEPVAAAEPVRPLTPLSEPLSYLLYPDAGAAWYAAATQAARLLTPFGRELEGDEYAQDQLACLALIIYTLADESLIAPAMVPIEEIGNILRQHAKQIEHCADAEPQKLKHRISEALGRTGHWATRAVDPSGTIPQVYQLYVTRSREDWHVGQNRAYLPAGPSDLARLLPWLARRLSRLDTAELGPAPRPAGKLTVNVSGKIWTAPSMGTVDTPTLLACEDCGSVQGAIIIVDRTRVTLACANRHLSHPKELSAPTVRLALRETAGRQRVSVDPASDGPRAAGAASTANIRGSFRVRNRVAYDLKLAEQPSNHPDD